MLKTLPNSTTGNAIEIHTLDIPPCCPVSRNPRPGSTITISYRPSGCSLEIASLYAYIHAFRGGLYDEHGQLVIRDMEGMIQRIADDCASLLGVDVEVVADLQLLPRQQMKLHFNQQVNNVMTQRTRDMTIQEMKDLMQRYQELEEQRNDDFLPEQQKIREQFAAIGLHISVDGYGSVAVWLKNRQHIGLFSSQ